MQNSTIDLNLMRQGAAEAVDLLKLMANTDRLMLLCQLSQAELCVSELEERLRIVQPTLSQQLGVLRSEGAVATRREGKRIFYRVSDQRLLRLLDVMYHMFCPQECQNDN